MIGFLRGKIISRQAPHLLLDVNGVGYEVEATMTTFYNLPKVGEAFSLYTHLVVREDAQLLYGFSSESERTMFRSLIKINGVGAKLALTILSGMSVEEFATYVRDNNSTALVKLPGVGKKTAERLIIEMRDRLTDEKSTLSTVDTSAQPFKGDEVSDAVSALTALGYKGQEASRMVRNIDVNGKGSEEIIREALKSTVKAS
ncbi:MAG: Holliday junction branch migration protein RuvA [Gammaproteobacteria bacterium]